MLTLLLKLALVAICLSDNEHVKLNITEGGQIILTCKKDDEQWKEPFSKVDWYQMNTVNDVKVFLVEFKELTKSCDINKKVKHRFDAISADCTILRINQTDVADQGLYKCAVTHEDGHDQVYFELTLISYALESPVQTTGSGIDHTINKTEKNKTETRTETNASDIALKVVLPIGILFVAACIIAIIVFCVRRKRKADQNNQATNKEMASMIPAVVTEDPEETEVKSVVQEAAAESDPAETEVKSVVQEAAAESGKQWRPMDFSAKHWDDLIKTVRKTQVPEGVKSLNILLLGRVGHGKSSFVKTCNTAMIPNKNQNIQELGRLNIMNVASEKSVTIRYRGHTFPSEKDQKMRFRLYDTKGMNQSGHEGISSAIISDILQGHVKDGYPFEENVKDSEHFRSHPKLEDRIHCVAVCVETKMILSAGSKYYTKFLLDLQRKIYREEMDMYILLTKIDEVCTETYANTEYALESTDIEEATKKITDLLHIRQNQIYPIRSYVETSECRDKGIEILALSAIKAMLESACTHVDACLRNV